MEKKQVSKKLGIDENRNKTVESDELVTKKDKTSAKEKTSK